MPTCGSSRGDRNGGRDRDAEGLDHGGCSLARSSQVSARLGRADVLGVQGALGVRRITTSNQPLCRRPSGRRLLCRFGNYKMSLTDCGKPRPGPPNLVIGTKGINAGAPPQGPRHEGWWAGSPRSDWATSSRAQPDPTQLGAPCNRRVPALRLHSRLRPGAGSRHSIPRPPETRQPRGPSG
jgi:hypothetical protein